MHHDDEDDAERPRDIDPCGPIGIGRAGDAEGGSSHRNSPVGTELSRFAPLLIANDPPRAIDASGCTGRAKRACLPAPAFP